MYKAAEKGKTSVVRLLLENNADPNRGKTGNGVTPIYIAAQKGFAGVVKALLEHDADPSNGRSDGWTPLKKATQKGHTAVADLLTNYVPI